MIEDGALKEDFQIELLGTYPLEECLEREKDLAMTSLFPKGLNGNAGSAIVQNDEIKKKNSDAHKGEKNVRFGKTHSDETKRKMSVASKGKPKSEEHRRKNSESQKGKTISEEQRKKISDSLKGRPRSEETKEKIRLGHFRRNKNKLNED